MVKGSDVTATNSMIEPTADVAPRTAGERVSDIVVAILLMLTLAAMGIGAFGWIGWQGAPSLPTTAAVTATLDAAAPGERVKRVERQDHLFGDAYSAEDPLEYLFGDDDYGSGYVFVTTTGSDDEDGRVAAARTGLAANGWRVRSDSTSRPGLVAAKGQTVLTVSLENAVDVYGAPDVQLGFEFVRAEPNRVAPLTFAGGLVGLLLGGWAAAWLRSRRMWARRGPSALMRLGLLLLMPATAATLVVFVEAMASPAINAPTAPWDVYMGILVRPMVLVGCLCLVIGAALVAKVPASRDPKGSA